jgi:hypothetical protein
LPLLAIGTGRALHSDRRHASRPRWRCRSSRAEATLTTEWACPTCAESH